MTTHRARSGPAPPAVIIPAPRAAPESGDVSLTGRDLTVLAALASRYSTAEIASSLSVSRNTARTRIRRVQSKLAVDGREEAVRAAEDRGVFTSSGPVG